MKTKKTVLALLAVCCITAVAGALAACGPGEHSHIAQKTEAKSATCTESGYEEYYTCSACHKLFSDEACEHEITAPTPIAAHHTATLTGQHDATCTEDGYEAYYKCSACYKLFSDEACEHEITAPTPIAAHHTATLTEQRDATCTEDGYEAYYKCSACYKLFSDEACEHEITAPTPIAAHHTATLTGQHDATCTEDGYEAYYKCSACYKLFSDEACEHEITAPTPIAAHHTATLTEQRDATCTEEGYEAFYTCSACRKLFSDEACEHEIPEPIVIAAHHTMEEVAAKPATCTEKGNEIYYECTECGTAFSDAEGTTQIDKTEKEIAATGHSAYSASTASASGGTSSVDCGVCHETVYRLPYDKGITSSASTTSPNVLTLNTEYYVKGNNTVSNGMNYFSFKIPSAGIYMINFVNPTNEWIKIYSCKIDTYIITAAGRIPKPDCELHKCVYSLFQGNAGKPNMQSITLNIEEGSEYIDKNVTLTVQAVANPLPYTFSIRTYDESGACNMELGDTVVTIKDENAVEYSFTSAEAQNYVLTLPQDSLAVVLNDEDIILASSTEGNCIYKFSCEAGETVKFRFTLDTMLGEVAYPYGYLVKLEVEIILEPLEVGVASPQTVIPAGGGIKYENTVNIQTAGKYRITLGPLVPQIGRNYYYVLLNGAEDKAENYIWLEAKAGVSGKLATNAFELPAGVNSFVICGDIHNLGVHESAVITVELVEE